MNGLPTLFFPLGFMGGFQFINLEGVQFFLIVVLGLLALAALFMRKVFWQKGLNYRETIAFLEVYYTFRRTGTAEDVVPIKNVRFRSSIKQ